MAELNDEQTRELNRAAKLLSFLNTDPNPGIWTGYVPFADEVTLMEGYVGKINNLVPQKEQSGKTVTTSKDEYKQKFAKAAGGLFSIAGQYAKKFNDVTLAGQVKKSESDIYALKDTEIAGFSTSLNTDIFTSVLLANTDFIPYGITLTMVDAAVALGTSFDKNIGVSAGITVVSDTANTDITTIVDDMRKSVGTMLGLKSNFEALNSSFVTGLEKAAVRDDIGVRHTGMLPTITVGGVGVAGGTVVIGKKSTVSNEVGVCKPLYVMAGDRVVNVTLYGKPTKTFVHHFIKAQVDKMNFDF